MVYDIDSTIISIRIPREPKGKMKKININWSDEIRKFIEKKIRNYELLEAFEEISSRAKRRRVRVNSRE